MQPISDASSAPLSETVLSRLREEIIGGDLLPGTPLSIPALATRWGVSRSPVREAVQKLVSDGLAEFRPNAGARVAELDRETLCQVFGVRELLDGLAAREAVHKLTAADLAELWAMIEKQEAFLNEPPDAKRDAGFDLEFHTLIRDLSGNRPLGDALRKLDVQSYLYRSHTWRSDPNRRHAVNEHRAIVTALEAGDVYGAEQTAKSHTAAVLVRILRQSDVD